MAKLTRSSYQALLLHDARFSLENLSTTYSSYNEGSPELGEPQPGASKGWMGLEATGTATVGDDYDIETMFSGRPVGGASGSTFRWRKDGEAASSWRGFLAHNKVTGCQWVEVGNFDHPRAVTLPTGVVVAVYAAGSVPSIKAASRSVAGVWSVVTITTDATANALPTIVRLPDNSGADSGRLICIFVRDDLTEGGATFITLATHYSDDDGATWAEVASATDGMHVPTTSLTTSLTILSADAIYHSGYITVAVSIADAYASPENALIYHLVSTDNGSSFEQVEIVSDGDNTDWRRNPHLFVDSAGAVGMVYFFDDTPTIIGSGGGVRWVKKEAPLATFAGSATYDSTFTPAIPADDGARLRPIAAGLDAEGFLWVLARQPTEARVYGFRFDADSMAAAPDRWLRYSPGTASETWRHPIETGDNAAYLLDMDLVPGPDGLLLLTENAITGGVMEVSLGGYVTRDWRVQTFGFRGNAVDERVGNSYLPIDVPSNLGLWTAAVTGTEAISATGLDLTTAGVQTASYARDGSASTDDGNPCLCMFTVHVKTGGSLATNAVAVRLRRADGTVHYEVALRLSTTAGGLVDINNASAVIGTDATGLAVEERDWMIVQEGNTVSTWYKSPYTSVWTVGPTGTSTDAAGATTPNQVEWGHITGSAATSSWRWFGNAIDFETAPIGLSTQTAADLQGRPYSQNPIYLDNGWLLRGNGGSTFKGDTWDATAASRYPVANVHTDVSPSPTVQWRSSDTTEQILAWELTGTDPTYLLNSSLGVALLRPNFRTSYFEGRTAGGSWVTLITFDTAVEYEGTAGAPTYTAAGDHVYPATGTNAGKRAFAMDELRDGYAILESTGDGGGDIAVKILHNSEGVWRPGTAGRPVDMRVAPVPTTGAVETTIRLIPPAVVGVVHEITNAHYVAFRLRIPASQATVGGFYHLGGLVAGPLAIFAPEAANARVFSSAGNVEATYDSAGRGRVRQRGAPRREVQFSWSDPVWTADLYEDDADPDYLAARSAAAYEGFGMMNDARLLEGVLRRSDAGALPVVWIERVDPANVTTDQFVYVDPANFVVGRLFGPVTRQAVHGDNLKDGFYVLNRASIVEIK